MRNHFAKQAEHVWGIALRVNSHVTLIIQIFRGESEFWHLAGACIIWICARGRMIRCGNLAVLSLRFCFNLLVLTETFDCSLKLNKSRWTIERFSLFTNEVAMPFSSIIGKFIPQHGIRIIIYSSTFPPVTGIYAIFECKNHKLAIHFPIFSKDGRCKLWCKSSSSARCEV